MRLKSMMACAAVAVMAPAALVACGSSSSKSGTSTTSKSTSSSTSSSKDAVCTAADNLKQSMKALTDPSLLTGGKSGIESAVSKVKSDFSAFESAAKGSYQTQTDAMKSSLDQLETAVGDLGNGNATQNHPQGRDRRRRSRLLVLVARSCSHDQVRLANAALAQLVAHGGVQRRRLLHRRHAPGPGHRTRSAGDAARTGPPRVARATSATSSAS